MNEVTQIRVGKHMTGIIGLKAAFADAATRCKGISSDQIGKILLENLSKRNYIEISVTRLYQKAFLREYRKFIGEPVRESREQGLYIKVLGPGCPQCERLEHEVMNAMAETGIAADLEHVREPAEIVRYGVMGMPVLVINSAVKAVGNMPPRSKIIQWLNEAKQM